jgi:hypothetical protein
LQSLAFLGGDEVVGVEEDVINRAVGRLIPRLLSVGGNGFLIILYFIFV